MKSKILFANIGWMTHYKGNTKKDQIVGGGSWSNDDKHEAFNFSPIKGKCYGYVQPVRWGAISLNRIGDDYKSDLIKDVTVVWIATHPKAKGTYIIGWYKNATVFSKFQESNMPARNNYAYNIVAKEEDCTLLPLDQRTFLIPRAKDSNKGFLGQSNVWYADSSPKLLLRLMDDSVLSLDGYMLGSTNKSEGAVMIGNTAVAINHFITEAKFPITKDQIEQFSKGIKKLRLNTSPKYHEKEWRKDKIGKKLFAKYKESSSNSFEDNF